MNTTTTYKPVNVLVIESNDDHWVLIRMAIQKSFKEFVATRATSVAEAEAFLEECLIEEWNLPKLILQDLYLPGLEDGLTLVRQVKAMSASHRVIPIIVFSSSSLRVDITKAYEAGISSYCLKPVRLEGWISLVEDLRIYWLETATLPLQQYSLF